MFSEIGTIFMLHRIAPYERGKIVYNEDMKISPHELKLVIKQLKSKKRVFVSMDELEEITGDRKDSSYKFAALAMDDGYKDNIEYGYPIFKEQNIPFCIYITNSFPNKTTNLWWYALEELILNNDTLRWPEKTKVDNSSEGAKNRNFLLLRKEILNHYFLDPIAYLRNVGYLEFDLVREIMEKCMTWEEIITLSRDPLATLGAHTMNHYPLSRLSEKVAEYEMRNSRKELEEKTGKPVYHFAFPFGGKEEAYHREYALARSIEFKSATTTLNGHIFKKDSLLRLPRIYLRPLQNNSLTLDDLMKKNIKDYVKYARRSIINMMSRQNEGRAPTALHLEDKKAGLP